MHLGAPVKGQHAVGFRIPIHRGQRRDAQPFDRIAEEQLRADVHHLPFAGGALGDVHAIGARNRGAVHQRIDRHIGMPVLGLFDVKLGKQREFLGRGHARVDRKAARRHAILSERPRGAEIARAQKADPVGLQVRVHQPEAGKPGALGQLPRRAVLGHVKEARVILDLPRLAVLDNADLDRIAEIGAKVKELHRHIADLHGFFGPEADLPMRVIVDLFQHVGLCHDRRLPGLAGQIAGALGQHVEAEALRRAIGRRELCLGGRAGGGGSVLCQSRRRRQQRGQHQRQGGGVKGGRFAKAQDRNSVRSGRDAGHAGHTGSIAIAREAGMASEMLSRGRKMHKLRDLADPLPRSA